MSLSLGHQINWGVEGHQRMTPKQWIIDVRCRSGWDVLMLSEHMMDELGGNLENIRENEGQWCYNDCTGVDWGGLGCGGAWMDDTKTTECWRLTQEWRW